MRRKRQGASGIWTAVAFAAFLMRQYQKRAANDVVQLREELKPGRDAGHHPHEAASRLSEAMKVLLRNPKRELDDGRGRCGSTRLLERLDAATASRSS